MVKKAKMVRMMSSAMVCCPILTGSRALGWSMRLNSFCSIFSAAMSLTHFTPPAVEPEHEPMTEMTSKMIHARRGHAMKLSVVKPVVVCIDTTWKNAFRKSELSLPLSKNRQTVMRAVLPERI